MGLNRRFTDPKVIDNDAIVVLCLTGPDDTMTHHQFRERASKMGFTLSRSDCHNMLHRAMGRVKYTGAPAYQWSLTAQGIEYRKWVLATLKDILNHALPPPPIPGT